MEKKCAICSKTKDLFSIELISDDGEPFTKFVCGTCWEVIGEIAVRSVKAWMSLIQVTEPRPIKETDD